MICTWAVATHLGFGPEINQDRMHPAGSGRSSEPVVIMVADGLGGEKFGHVSAELAVTTARAVTGSPADRVRAANEAILELVRREPRWAGTYTTLTLVEFAGGMARVAHVGDTRAYLYRQGRIMELTNDHTVAWQWVQRGMDPIRVQNLPSSGSLVRVLGFDTGLEVEETKMSLKEGDRWLVCSDGLYRMLSDQDMRRALESGDAEECVWGLVEIALGRGASDNVTVVLADISS